MSGAAPKPHAGSSDGDTAIDFLGDVVTWPVLLWFARQRGMKNWVCGGLVNVGGAADGPCCARDRQPENTRNISLVIYVYSRKMKGKRKDEEGTERRT